MSRFAQYLSTLFKRQYPHIRQMSTQNSHRNALVKRAKAAMQKDHDLPQQPFVNPAASMGLSITLSFAKQLSISLALWHSPDRGIRTCNPIFSQ